MSDMLPIAPGPQRVDPHAPAERRRKRGRRRLAVWGAFLLIGLLLGTIYATGFAVTGGVSPLPDAAAANNNEPAINADTSALAGLIYNDSVRCPGCSIDLRYNWTGRWGEISSAVLYEVDLTGFPTDLFFVEVVLTNVPEGFSDLQIQYRLARDGGNGCDTGDLSVTSTTRVMIFDAEDAQVTFSGLGVLTDGLPGGGKYCIGVFDYSSPAPGSGKDLAGTFIRKSIAGNDISEIIPPEFVGTLNRMQ